jgi:hypothetical protein
MSAAANQSDRLVLPTRVRRRIVIGYNGISLPGLTDPERHQVLSRGWGRLDRQRVLLYLPRDESELAICWSILYRAYNSIINSPEQMSASPRAHFDDYPEPSHTSLV